jgi:hypothetical protein
LPASISPLFPAVSAFIGPLFPSVSPFIGPNWSCWRDDGRRFPPARHLIRTAARIWPDDRSESALIPGPPLNGCRRYRGLAAEIAWHQILGYQPHHLRGQPLDLASGAGAQPIAAGPAHILRFAHVQTDGLAVKPRSAPLPSAPKSGPPP